MINNTLLGSYELESCFNEAVVYYFVQKWIPAVKEKCVKATTYVGPHVEKVSTKSVEIYRVCRSTITPHFVKVQELTAPYVLVLTESPVMLTEQ